MLTRRDQIQLKQSQEEERQANKEAAKTKAENHSEAEPKAKGRPKAKARGKAKAKAADVVEGQEPEENKESDAGAEPEAVPEAAEPAVKARPKAKGKAKAKGKSKAKAKAAPEPPAEDEPAVEEDAQDEPEDEDAEEDKGCKRRLEKEFEECAVEAHRKKSRNGALSSQKGTPEKKRPGNLPLSPSMKKELKRRKKQQEASMRLQPKDLEDTEMQAFITAEVMNAKSFVEQDDLKGHLISVLKDHAWQLVRLSEYWQRSAVGVVMREKAQHVTSFSNKSDLGWNVNMTAAYCSARILAAWYHF